MDPDAAAILDEQTGESTSPSGPVRQGGMTGYDPGVNGGSAPREGFGIGYGDSGGASRFFYCAKSSSAERNAGLDGQRSTHPTVKPVRLMSWLVRLVTPPGGLVLDPFTGSGTTGCAAALEGFRFVGLEREPEYVAIARARIAWWAEHPDGMQLVERLEAERERKAIADSGQLGLFGEAA
jgi:site-specific DNA-methyltransferase (adenine-specific)